ncbi:uracil nucleotide/cysteinyl leukotriene receptor-like [Clarias gariepinus]|uniref:uracil nucleotide/cysteinyl leukotriene receptor-like n=1 Tax=Clarias gariepinus TaxID=13013 RepID=UPI00234D3063|nr:uracil nucleotide/cysteinyl leukotriene receptor-like [Clarias gariepinus]
MEIHNDNNNSLFLIGNVSVAEKTVYEMCRHMPSVILFYLGMQFINMFMGIPANLMVLWLIRRNRSDSTTSDIFIWHLAVLDTFFCLIPPLELVNLLYLSTSSTWYVLRFWYGIKDSSPLFLACICLDRYMAVRHPIIFSNLKDRPHRPVCASVVWFITLVYAILKCLGTIPNFDKVFTIMILTTFAFMLFCNISILCALHQSGPGRDDMHPVKKRAFKMVLIILAIIVFNYFPPVALFPFQIYFSPDVFKCYIHYIAFGFMDISSSIQPLMYLSNKKPQCPGCCSECCSTKDTETASIIEPSTVYSNNG